MASGVSSAASRCLAAAPRARAAPSMPASVDWSALEQRRRPARRRSRRAAGASSSRAYSACLSSASRMPRPNSALSSNSELDQAGPRPGAVDASRAWSAGCRRRSTSSRWRWRSAARSPNSWRQQLEVRASRRSRRRRRRTRTAARAAATSLTLVEVEPAARSVSGRSRKKSQFGRSALAERRLRRHVDRLAARPRSCSWPGRPRRTGAQPVQSSGRPAACTAASCELAASAPAPT